jgi:hypothetical protein
MSLFPDEIRNRLPPLGSQQDEPDPVVYARLYLPGTSWNFYVIEGGIEAGYWVLFCFFATSEKWGFSQFPLDLLEFLRGPDDQVLILDPDFPEGRLTDVVPAPDF